MKGSRWFSAVLLVLLVGCGGGTPPERAGQPQVSVSFSVNGDELVGGERVLTPLAEVAAASGSVTMFKPVDGIQLALLLDASEEVVGLSALAAEDAPLLFDAARTAQAFVLINGIFWGWSPEALRGIHEVIPDHPDFGALAARVRGAGRLDTGDAALVTLANQIAEDVAKAYAEPDDTPIDEGDGLLAPQAILQQLSPWPRFVGLRQPDAADLRQVRVTNRGLMNHRIFAFERGSVEDYTLDFLNAQEGAQCRNQGGKATNFLEQPFKLFGWMPIDFVTGRNYLDCILPAEPDSYKVFEVVACTHCSGENLLESPRAANMLEFALSIFNFATGAGWESRKLIQNDNVRIPLRVLLASVELPLVAEEVSNLLSQKRYPEAASLVVDQFLIKNLRLWVELYIGVTGDKEAKDVAVDFFKHLVLTLEPTLGGTFEKIETIGSGVYVAAFVASYFLTISEYKGSFPTALVSTQDPKLDVAFLFDSTASMGDIIGTAKRRASDIQRGIRRSGVFGAETRFGLADFRDYPQAPYGWSVDYPFRLRQQLTLSDAAWEGALNNVFANGGRDAPEAHLTALFEAARSFEWRQDAFPILILITDAPAHDSDVTPAYPGVGFAEATAALNQQGVKVIGLAASSSALDTLYRLADATGARLADGSLVVLPITLSGTDLVEQVLAALESLLGLEPSSLRLEPLPTLPALRSN